MEEMQTNFQSPEVLNTKKLMKELLTRFKVSLPQKGAVLDGEVISVSLSVILIDLGPLGIGAVYPTEFYNDLEKQRDLKPGERVKVVLLELENEEGLRELSLKRAQKQAAWQTIKELHDKGEIITVKINNLNKGGLITEIAGIQAFMPLSQLTEEHYPKVENGAVQEIVRIIQSYRNQEFTVKIIDFDESQNKLIISEKAAKQALLKEKLGKYNVGDVVEVEVSEITDFGAFARPVAEQGEVISGVDALIPKAEIEEDKLKELEPGKRERARIIQITPEKIVLSLKEPPEKTQ